ncbi:MAG: hypothetical protein KDB63_21975 [Nocardioidaceae bacterium]|nr:hypothetical protein [Nocardioidaceae bacterium]
MTRPTRCLVATCANVALLTGVLVAAAAPAEASGGGPRVEKRGPCTKSAVWKVKAKGDDSRIEVEGEVDSNRNGQVWSWKIRHNGSVSAKGQSTTKAPSGSFSVERRMVDLTGPDSFVFRAVNVNTGEVCRGSVTL